ncbi:MAG: hypothetical protein ABI597_08605 [Gammaproteobacteria bacterium]
MKNPSSLTIPLQKKSSAPLCNLNCTCNQLREKMNQHLIMLISIAEGLALTYYISDESIPEKLRQEGISDRKQFFSMLFQTIQRIDSDVKEVPYV